MLCYSHQKRASLRTAYQLNSNGLRLNKEGDSLGALECFLEAHARRPENPTYIISAANMILKSKCDNASAVALYKRAMGLNLTKPMSDMVVRKLQQAYSQGASVGNVVMNGGVGEVDAEAHVGAGDASLGEWIDVASDVPSMEEAWTDVTAEDVADREDPALEPGGRMSGSISPPVLGQASSVA